MAIEDYIEEDKLEKGEPPVEAIGDAVPVEEVPEEHSTVPSPSEPIVNPEAEVVQEPEKTQEPEEEPLTEKQIEEVHGGPVPAEGSGQARTEMLEEAKEVEEKPLLEEHTKSWLKSGNKAGTSVLRKVANEIVGGEPAEDPENFMLGVLHSAFEGNVEFYGNLVGEGINEFTEMVYEQTDGEIDVRTDISIDFPDYVPPQDRGFLGTLAHEGGAYITGYFMGGGPINQVFKLGSRGIQGGTKLIQGGSKALNKVVKDRLPSSLSYMGSKAVTTKDKMYDIFLSLGGGKVVKGGKWVAQKGTQGAKVGFTMDILRTTHETVFDALPPNLSAEFMRSETLDRSIIAQRLTQGFEGLIFGGVAGPLLSGVARGGAKTMAKIRDTSAYKHINAFHIQPLAVKIETAHKLRRLFKNPTLTQKQIKEEIDKIHKNHLTGVKAADAAQKFFLKTVQKETFEKLRKRKEGRIQARKEADAVATQEAVDDLYLNVQGKPGISNKRDVSEVGESAPTAIPKVETKALSRPHTMTATEYIDKLGPTKVEEMGGLKAVTELHKEAVDTALGEGKTVQKFIVDKYPDVKQKHFGDAKTVQVDSQAILRNLRAKDNKSKSKTPDYHLRQFARQLGIETVDAEGKLIRRGRLEEQIAEHYGDSVGRGQGRRRAEGTAKDPEFAVWTYTDDPEMQNLLRDAENDPEFLEIVAQKEKLSDEVVLADLDNQFEMRGFENIENSKATVAQAREAGRNVTALQFQVTKKLEKVKELNDKFQELVLDESTPEKDLVDLVVEIQTAQRDMRKTYALAEMATSEIAASLRRTQLTKVANPYSSKGFGVIESREQVEELLLALGDGDINKGLKLHAKQQKHLDLEEARAVVQTTPSYVDLLTNVYAQDVINSMLSSPQTAIINAVSPVLTIGIDFIENTIGSTIRGALTLDKREFQRAWVNAKSHMEYVSGLQRAVRIGMQTFKSNKSAFDDASRLNEPLQEGIESGNRISTRAGFEEADRTGLTNFFDWIAIANSGASRFLGSVDDFWKSLIYQQHARAQIEISYMDRMRMATQESYERMRILADEGDKTYANLTDDDIKGLALEEAKELVLQNKSLDEVVATQHKLMMQEDGMYTHQKVGNAAIKAADEALESGEIARSEYTAFVTKYMRDNFDQSLVAASKLGLDQARRMTFTTPLEKELREGASRHSIGPGMAQAVGTANKAIDQVPLAGPLLRTQIPFVRTPYNLIEWLTDRKTLVAIPKVIKELRRDLRGLNGSPADAEIARRSYGKAMFALFSTYKAYELALEGRITGNGPPDPETRKQWKAAGWRKNSYIHDDGTHTDLIRLMPFLANPLAAGDAVEFMQATEGGTKMTAENLKQFVVRDFVSLYEQLDEMPFLQGLSQVFKLRDGEPSQREQILRNITRQTMPYASGFRSFATENVKRQQQSFLDGYQSNLSWLQGYSGPMDRTWMSEPVSKLKIKPEQGWINYMKDVFNPLRRTAAVDDVVANEIKRLTSGSKAGPRGEDANYFEGDTVQSPFQPLPKYVTISGIAVPLDKLTVDVEEEFEGKKSTNKGTYWHLLNRNVWDLKLDQEVTRVVINNKTGNPEIKSETKQMNIKEAIANLFVTEATRDVKDENGDVVRNKKGAIKREVYNPYEEAEDFDYKIEKSMGGDNPLGKVAKIKLIVNMYREIAKAQFASEALQSSNSTMQKVGLYVWLSLGNKVAGLKSDLATVNKYYEWINELETGDLDDQKSIRKMKDEVQLYLNMME
tara:strand:- start:4100 stop:9349 length:5250 start_codon:yes stop_codon:yes gene_type:complete